MPIVPLTQLTAQPVDWLWPGRLARGHLHMIDGDPGLGKSLVLLDLAARLTTGRPLPDGAGPVEPMSVVVLNAEDGACDTTLPRLLAAGADPARVEIWAHAPGDLGLRFPSRLRELEAVLGRTRAGLVIVDPLLAFLDRGVNIGSDPSVRDALAPLRDLAETYRPAFALQRHLGKARQRQAVYRGLGSIAFSAAARINWHVGADPKVRGQCVLAQAKNNLQAPPPSLAYRIVGGDGGVARVDWLGPSSWTQDDLAAARPTRGRARRRAAAFLEQFLRAGPQPAHAIFAAGRVAGLSERTLERAAEDLGLRMQRVGAFRKEQTNYWMLGDDRLPPDLLPPGAAEVSPVPRPAEEEATQASGEPPVSDPPGNGG